MTVFALWYLSGLFGSYMVFQSNRIDKRWIYQEEQPRCPTRIGLIGLMLLAPFGPVLIPFGGFVLFASVYEAGEFPECTWCSRIVEWFKQPLCK